MRISRSPFRHHLGEHEVATVGFMGWSGTKNGELITLIEGAFDILITGDQNLRYQQNLRHRKSPSLSFPPPVWTRSSLSSRKSWLPLMAPETAVGGCPLRYYGLYFNETRGQTSLIPKRIIRAPNPLQINI